MSTRTPFSLVIGAATLALLPLAWFRGNRRSFSGQARELLAYRSTLASNTRRAGILLGELGDLVDALRRRAVDVDEAVDRLAAGEDELDGTAETLREMAAPEDLHGLHLEYEANLERALRGIVTAERGCGLQTGPGRQSRGHPGIPAVQRRHLHAAGQGQRQRLARLDATGRRRERCVSRDARARAPGRRSLRR